MKKPPTVGRRARALRRLALIPLCAVLLPAAAQTVLPEVVVSATRFAEPGASLPAGVSTLTAEQIRSAGATTVNEAVMKLLGVPGRLDISGGNNYSLDLRGFGTTSDSNQVVIVDGLRLNEGDSVPAHLASIPIDQVERIEVMRGTGAVLYGEGATGGVIVITTKAGLGIERRNAATLYGAVGSRGLRDARATATLATGGFSLDIGASDRRSNGHRDNFASSADSLGATAQWSNDWLRLGLRAGRDASSSGLPGPLTAAQYDADPTQAGSLIDYGAVQRSHNGLFVDAMLGDWQLVFDTHQRRKHYDSMTFGSPYGYGVDARNTSLRARHEGRLGGMDNVFVAGWDRSDWERTITRSFFTPVGTTARAHAQAFYLRDDLTLGGSGTHLSAGWRTEKLDKDEAASAAALRDREHAWELGLTQPFVRDWSAYGRVGRSFRLANADEFSFTNPAVALRPQTSRDVEFGLRWKTAAHRAELRAYRHALRDEIGYDPGGNGPYGPFGANINFDATRRQGLELETQHALSASVDLSLHAAWRKAEFTAGPYAGNDVMLVPRRTLALRADWRLAPGHRLNAGLRWVSSQHPDFANQCRMPSFTLVDLRYAWQWQNAELALGIENLGDRKYYTQAFGCIAATGRTTSIYPEAGRTFTASVRVAF